MLVVSLFLMGFLGGCATIPRYVDLWEKPGVESWEGKTLTYGHPDFPAWAGGEVQAGLEIVSEATGVKFRRVPREEANIKIAYWWPPVFGLVAGTSPICRFGDRYVRVWLLSPLPPLRWVVAHEVMHSMGSLHSPFSPLMNPFIAFPWATKYDRHDTERCLANLPEWFKNEID